MKYFDLLRFGLKNIGRQKARSLLTIFAIVIGATSVVATLTIAFTAKNILLSQIESAGALTQITVTPDTTTEGADLFNINGGGSDTATKITPELVTQIRAIPHVMSVIPLVSLYQLRTATIGDKKANIDQTMGTEVGGASDKVISHGRNLQMGDTNSIVLGSRYVKQFGFDANPQDLVGKTLTFQTKGYTGLDTNIPKPPIGNDRAAGDAYNNDMQNHISTIEVKVVGIMSSALYDNQAYVPMDWARKIMEYHRWEMVEQKQQFDSRGFPIGSGTPEFVLKTDDGFDRQGYTAIIVKADGTETVGGIAEKIKTMKLGAATAQEMIEEFMKIFRIVALVLGAVGAISLFVAAIGVINTMIMATLERTKEIGLLRACGATRSTVRRLFTFEASLLGMLGGLVGVGVAYGLVYIARRFGAESLASQGIDAAVVNIPIWLAGATVVTTTIIGTLAGMAPAIRASRLNPIEALRYE